MTTIRLFTAQSLEALRQKSLQSNDLLIQTGRPWVARRGVAACLPSGSRDLLVALLVHGRITMTELVDALYGDDPAGGPEDAPNAIQRRKYDIKTVAAALKIKVGRDSICQFAELLR